jgi:hypothetical protein
MKRVLISALTTLISVGAVAATAHASQVNPRHDAADINGDGEVTLTELRNYNRDQRQS